MRPTATSAGKRGRSSHPRYATTAVPVESGSTNPCTSDGRRGWPSRLVDLAQVVPSPVNVVEGVVGREGTGFRRGLNRTMRLAVAGTNPVAVDSVASYLMGFDPAGLLYLKLAAQAGLGSNDLGALTVFEVRDGVVVPCTDLAALRADPPFRVIREIRGEEEWIPPEA